MTIQAGSTVTILAPFNAAFPDSYVVVHVFDDGSCMVATPGWIAPGVQYDPALGPNFAGMYVQDTGATLIDLSTVPGATAPAPGGAPQETAPAPQSITMLQLKLCLVAAGAFDGINAAIQAMPQTSAAYLAWNSAATIDRTSPLLASLATQFNLTSQLDALWASAAAIVV